MNHFIILYTSLTELTGPERALSIWIWSILFHKVMDRITGRRKEACEHGHFDTLVKVLDLVKSGPTGILIVVV